MQGKSLKVGCKPIHRAVLAALPVLMVVHANSGHAACAGSIASPVSAANTVLCNGTGTSGNLNNSSTSVYTDTTTTTTAGNNTLIQLDGQGRTLVNTGDIINNRVISGTAGARGRTAVLIGAATINAGSGTLFSNTTTPSAGVTSVKLNTAPTASLVGQTIVLGRFNAAEGDFGNGEQRLITAIDTVAGTVSFAQPLSANFAGAGSDPAGYKIISNFGAGDNIVRNSGTISSQILAAEINANRTGASPTITSVSYTAAVRAITASVEGDYVINNTATGVISAKHDGIGNAYGIEQGGAVEEMTVNNAGLISAQRTASLTLVGNTATATPTATSTTFSGFSAQNIGNVNAINTQEEAEKFTLNNKEGGVVHASGDYVGAIYMRAGEKYINNDGLIERVGTKGFAIGAVSDGGEIRTLELNNSETGEIKGDILVVNGNGLRYYTLTTQGGAAGLNSRLNINNQWGQSDSAISNAGNITGNFYYANGTHTLENENTGVIAGNIDVDQRNTTFTTTSTCTASATVTCAAAGTTTRNPSDNTSIVTTITNTTTNAFGQNTSTSVVSTVTGSKDFNFSNQGSYTGDLTVRTDAGSKVTLTPTVKGTGAASSQTAPSGNIAGMGGTLKIWDGTASTIATTTTLKPQIVAGAGVKSGEWFKVADNVFGSDLPAVESTALVNWQAAKNLAGNLVIGANVANAASVAGVSAASANVINTLIASSDPLAGAVQGLSSAAQVARAGEQLRPEINGGAYQAASKVVNQVLAVVENHLAETHLAATTGNTGVSTGEAPYSTGVWVQGFGFTGEQDKRKGVDGYDADSYGFAFGADKLLDAKGNLRVGAAFSYGQSNVDDRGVNAGNRVDIDSYQVTLYGAYTADKYYLNASLGLAKHDFDTKRLVLNNTVNGSYDAWQYVAKVDAGMPIELGKAVFIPVASLVYSYLDEDSYTENGSGALRINGDNTDSFRSGLGARVIAPIYEGEVKTALELRAIWNHEFADTEQDTTARFAAGGAAFNVNGVDIARDSANLGATLNLTGGKFAKQSLLMSYDAEVRSQFVSHTGKITARFEF